MNQWHEVKDCCRVIKTANNVMLASKYWKTAKDGIGCQDGRIKYR